MAQGRLSAPGLAQLVALGATELGPDYTMDMVAEYQARRDILYEGLRDIPGVLLRKPEGAFYFVARLPIEDARGLRAPGCCRTSRTRARPCSSPRLAGFYATPGLGRNEVRIAYVLKKEHLQTAVRVLALGLAAYREARGLGPVPAATATSSRG